MTEQILAAVVCVLASARLTRLVIHDTFPPSAWLRAKWELAFGDSAWGDLLRCHYCLAPWITGAVMLIGWAAGITEPSGAHGAVWFAAAWLGLSYAASIVVSYDGDD